MATQTNSELSQPILPETSIRENWINFVQNVKILLVSRKNNRSLDQYLDMRDHAIFIVLDEKFLTELDFPFVAGGDNFVHHQVAKGLNLELQAFSRAVEVAKTVGEPEKEKKWYEKWGAKLLKMASVTTSSVKDIGGKHFNSYVSGGLTLFNEAIDIFKEK